MSSLSLTQRPRWRYGVPLGALAVTAAAVVVPQLASGTSHPRLPAKTAGQLLAALHDRPLPQFTGTVVETTNLGLPDISENTSGLMSAAGSSIGGVEQVVSLLTGSHTAQIAYGGPSRQRVALFIDNLSETDVVHNGRDLWTYSSADNTFFHHLLPKEAASQDEGDRTTALQTMDPAKAAQQVLHEISPSTRVSVQRTAEVAGRSAYQLVIQPRDPASTIQAVDIAIDSATSLPLRVQVWARGVTSSPALEVAFTSLHLGAPSASTFSFTPPHAATRQDNPLDAGPLTGGEHGRRAVGAIRQTGPPPPVPPAPGKSTTTPGTRVTVQRERGRSRGEHIRMVGKDWTTVVEGSLPQGAAPAAEGGSLGPIVGIVERFGSSVTGGRLLRTHLVSALVTDDGRFFIGAVSPAYLERLASSGGGK